ncbi:MAG: OmpA family protein [Firmicutes bacterium]|nr:OmpA family protein [Bacillota bacterium]
MRNNRRNREAFSEHSYWQSYSDMMAALLLVFILIIAITLAIYKQKTTDLETTRQELSLAREDLEGFRAAIEKTNEELAASLAELQTAYEEAALTRQELNDAYLEIENAQKELTATKSELQDIVGIRTDIIGALQGAFNNTGMKVDAHTGSITFSSDVLFQFGSYALTEESEAALKEVIPKYLEVLLQDQYRGYIAEIIIEGHTDTESSYETNMELSCNRAKAVAEFCLDDQNGLSEEQILRLQQLLTVNGRSFSNPVYVKDSAGNPTAEVDMAASRRVEIKFRLKEDEMIEKITEVLNGQEGTAPE